MVRPHRLIARGTRWAYWSLREKLQVGMPVNLHAALDLASPRRILHFRTDAIGDHLLSTPILSAMRHLFPKAHLEVACPSRVAGLLEGDPRIDRMFTFDRGAFLKDASLATAWAQEFQDPWDLLLCPVISREPLTDLLVRHLPATVKVGFAGDLTNQPDSAAELRGRTAYTHCVSKEGRFMHELDRGAALLRALGWDEAPPLPDLLLSQAELEEARIWYASRGLVPERTLTLGLGAQDPIREVPNLGPALGLALQGRPLSLLALGTREERPRLEATLRACGLPWVDALGERSFRQSAALISLCTAFVGVESALSHVASATNRRSLVVLGGGHFGRFQPWGAWTVAATRPLPCFHCQWRCPFPDPTCLRGLSAETLSSALQLALDRHEPGPLVLHPADADPLRSDLAPAGVRWLRAPLS